MINQPDRVSSALLRKRLLAAVALPLLGLAGCASVPSDGAGSGLGVQTVQILALNDFHGNIESPTTPTRWLAGSNERQEPLGGAARMGAALGRLRDGQANTVTVAAGDLIGASPLASAHFLDEPSVMALNHMGLEIAAVGNHEFDRGTAELQRMQRGGCEKLTTREPCQLDRPFEGASFAYLAGNVLNDAGQTLFPGTAMRDFGAVRVGFIGLTLESTGDLVSPAGTDGYRFADEAETANRLAMELRAAGADAVVLLIHQGGYTTPINNEAACDGLTGPILPILDALDPGVGLVISGHTHAAYVCKLTAADGSTRLLTSAGRYGYFVTDIRLTVDPSNDRVAAAAVNVPVTAAAGEQGDIATLVGRYVAAAEPIAARVVGRVEGSLTGYAQGTDSPLANLLADAQLAATRDPANGGAQIAFMNSGGVRGRLTPAADGEVTYGQLFAVQPFGNTLVVLEMTGAQIRQLLEQQFTDASPAEIQNSLLIPSQGFRFTFDPARPVGERITEIAFDDAPLDPARSYRVTVNSFLATGGDGFATFTDARVIGDAGLDLYALETWVAQGARAPTESRVTRLGD